MGSPLLPQSLVDVWGEKVRLALCSSVCAAGGGSGLCPVRHRTQGTGETSPGPPARGHQPIVRFKEPEPGGAWETSTAWATPPPSPIHLS